MSAELTLVPCADEAEIARVHKLISRLPTQTPVRKAAETVLSGAIPVEDQVQACVAALASQDPSRWRERSLAAWVLGASSVTNENLSGTAESVARTLDNFDLKRDTWGRLRRAAVYAIPIGLAAVAVVVTVLTNLVQRAVHSPGDFGSAITASVSVIVGTFLCLIATSLGGYLSLLIDHRRITAVRLEAARALGRMRAPDYLGALARGISDRNPEIRRESLRAFHETLPALAQVEEGSLPKGLGRLLCGLLLGKKSDTDLSLAILKALPHVAAGEEITAVERYAEKARTKEQRELARSILPAIYARRDRVRQHERLLRPVSGSELPDTLLRPAQGAGDSEPDVLLRPSTNGGAA